MAFLRGTTNFTKILQKFVQDVQSLSLSSEELEIAKKETFKEISKLFSNSKSPALKSSPKPSPKQSPSRNSKSDEFTFLSSFRKVLSKIDVQDDVLHAFCPPKSNEHESKESQFLEPSLIFQKNAMSAFKRLEEDQIEMFVKHDVLHEKMWINLCSQFRYYYYLHGSRFHVFNIMSLVKSKKNAYDVIIDRSYISFEGPSVETAVINSSILKRLPSKYFSKRIARDGMHHHITLIKPTCYDALVEKYGAENLLDKLKECIDKSEPFSVVGVGRITEISDVFFLVIRWDSVSAFLSELGYPADLHITVGFSKFDIHTATKGAERIINIDELEIISNSEE